MIQRESYMRRIRPFIDKEIIKVLTGFRRSGKSVMLQLIQEELLARGAKREQIISFNFESMANAKYRTASALYEEIAARLSKISGKAYLFFDEIQEVRDWECCINSCQVDFSCDIYITGSNAKLLSGELATYLGGRYVEFVIYPFSFSEYLASRKTPRDIAREFRTYIELGGMPFLKNFPNDPNSSLQYLHDLQDSVVLKDIVKRNNVRDVDLLERLITYVTANIAHTFSARSISNYFKSERRNVSIDTILNHLRACSDAYLFRKICREDVIGKRILSVHEKYYIIDHGLREAAYGNNMRDIEQVLENIVCLELLRRDYTVTVGKVGEKEIDFIAKKDGAKIYIQVTYLLASAETAAREFAPYDDVRDNYPKYVLSLDEFDMSRDGIKHCNIRDFLLMDTW